MGREKARWERGLVMRGFGRAVRKSADLRIKPLGRGAMKHAKGMIPKGRHRFAGVKGRSMSDPGGSADKRLLAV